MYGATTSSLYLNRKTGCYSNTTGSVTFDPKEVRADSFNWWVFVTKINGKVVFNNYYYSSETSSQQSLVYALMCKLGIKIDVELNVRSSLDKLQSALIETYKKIEELAVERDRKNSKPSLNKSRTNQIAELEKQAKKLISLGAVLSVTQRLKIVDAAKAKEVERLAEQAVNREHGRRQRQAHNELLNSSFRN